MSLSDAAYRCGRALRRAGTHLHGLAETEGATPIRHDTSRVVRCERTREGAWVIHRQIAEDVDGREADAFAEMLGYARTALEAHAAEEVARAAARQDGARCDGPTSRASEPVRRVTCRTLRRVAGRPPRLILEPCSSNAPPRCLPCPPARPSRS